MNKNLSGDPGLPDEAEWQELSERAVAEEARVWADNFEFLDAKNDDLALIARGESAMGIVFVTKDQMNGAQMLLERRGVETLKKGKDKIIDEVKSRTSDQLPE